LLLKCLPIQDSEWSSIWCVKCLYQARKSGHVFVCMLYLFCLFLQIVVVFLFFILLCTVTLKLVSLSQQILWRIEDEHGRHAGNRKLYHNHSRSNFIVKNYTSLFILCLVRNIFFDISYGRQMVWLCLTKWNSEVTHILTILWLYKLKLPINETQKIWKRILGNI
jgi:hypothetical protein